MTLIDGDRIITAQLYDDEHEEFKEQKMSIIDFVNGYTDEGVTMADDALDKIRAEILDNAFSVVNPHNTYEYINVINLDSIDDIFDKYKGE